jgi:hypothetical protein
VYYFYAEKENFAVVSACPLRPFTVVFGRMATGHGCQGNIKKNTVWEDKTDCERQFLAGCSREQGSVS